MYLYGITLLWLVTAATVVGFKHHIKVCAKKKFSEPTKPGIHCNTTNFKDFVVNSDIFVDKSLLIKLILEEKPLVSLTYPRKWGKSINLNMLGTFLEMEIDHKGVPVPVNETWSYLFFKQGIIENEHGKHEELTDTPIIAEHNDIIEKHLARYPVIQIDLASPPSVKNFDDYFKEFRNAVAAVFEKHNFILDEVLNPSGTDEDDETKRKNQVKKFNAYKHLEVQDYNEMVKSLEFLRSMLHERFGRRVIVLIDNYDAPIRTAYFEQSKQMRSKERQKFMNFYEHFMTSTFINGKDIAKGVLTGILSLDICSVPFLGMNRTINYNAISRNTYPFHGFSALEVTQLLTHRFDSKFIDDVLKTYGGYHVLNFPDVDIYNPASIADILHNGKTDKNWFYNVCSEVPHVLPRVLRYEPVRDLLQKLISRSVDAKVQRRNFTLHRDDIVTFTEMMSNEDGISLTPDDVSLLVMYHIATGYLTLDFNSMFTNWSREIHIKIPCVPVERVIVKEMLRYYKNMLGNATSNSAELASTELVQYLNTYDYELEPLKKFYMNLFGNKSFPIPKTKLIDFAHFYLLLYLRSNYDYKYNVGLNTAYYDASEKKLSPYIVIYGHNTGVICGFTYTNDDFYLSEGNKKALYNRLEQYASYFDKKFVNIQILSVHYNYNMTWLSTRYGKYPE